MKRSTIPACIAGLLVGFATTSQAQVILFSEDFNTSLTAGAAFNSYSFGDTTSRSTGIVAGSGVGGTGGWETVNNAASGANSFSGVGAQYQRGAMSGNTSANLADYTLSFDVRADAGSLNIKVQTWALPGFGGSSATLDTAPPVGFGSDLALSSGFTHYSLNLADSTIWHNNTGLNMTGGTLQLIFQLDNGGPTPYSHTMDIDNLQLTMVPEPSSFALCGIGAAGFAFLRRRKA